MTRRDIPGYEGKYAATESGEIYSYRIKRNLKQQKQWAGYHLVGLNGRTTKAVHRLIAAAWLPLPPTSKHQINHIDSDKDNNAPSNLEWVTQSENIIHAKQNGMYRTRYGENTSGAKLTAAQVSNIRKVHAKGGISQLALAAQYGIDPSTISLIISNKRWGKG